MGSFRKKILDALAIRATVKPENKLIDPQRMQAFTRKELEVALTVFHHLNSLGYTFIDLQKYIEKLRKQEASVHVKSAMQSTRVLTRQEKLAMKRAARNPRKRRGK